MEDIAIKFVLHQNAQFNAQMNSKVVSPRPTVHFHIRLDNDLTSTPVLDIV